MTRSYLVLTDSGGIQEEAPVLGKPVLAMREVTERQESVWAGTVKLVATTRETILAEVKDLLENPGHYQAKNFSIRAAILIQGPIIIKIF